MIDFELSNYGVVLLSLFLGGCLLTLCGGIGLAGGFDDKASF